MVNEKGGGVPQFEAPSLTSEKIDQSAEKQVEEQRPAAKEAAAGKQTPAVLKVAPKAVSASATTPTQPQQSTKSDDQTLTPSSMMTAEDSDLIEKQWVQKAKAIVAKTQDDPYLQKKEMSKVKADYIQKRFKKIVKTDDAVAK